MIDEKQRQEDQAFFDSLTPKPQAAIQAEDHRQEDAAFLESLGPAPSAPRKPTLDEVTGTIEQIAYENSRPKGDGAIGLGGDLVRGAGSGLMRGAAGMARAIQWVADDDGPVDVLSEAVAGKIDQTLDRNADLFGESQESVLSRLESPWNARGWVYGASEAGGMMVPGIATALATGNPIAGAAVTGGQFWGDTAQQTYDEAEGLSESDRVALANTKGFAEGGIEALQMFIPFKVAKMLPAGLKSKLVGVAAGARGRGVKGIGKNLVKTIAAEVPMEMGQEFAGGAADFAYDQRESMPGFRDIAPVIGPTILLSGVLGGVGAIQNNAQKKMLHRALTDPEAPTEIRLKAVESVYQELKGQDKELAELWNTMAGEQAPKGPVAISLIEEEAARADGKDIDLLQGEAPAAPSEPAQEAINTQPIPEVPQDELPAQRAALEPDLPAVPPRPTEGPIGLEPQAVPPSAPEGVVEEVPQWQEALGDFYGGEVAEEVPLPVPPEEQDFEEAAHQAASSPLNDTPDPTEKQIEAGNYKKGHVKIHGLDISIENPKGSKRRGTDPDGKAWETEMQAHYGYIRGTEGKDKDHLDVFLGPNPEGEGSVFVVDQVDTQTGRFDEHKILMGFDSYDSAVNGYLANYDESGAERIGEVTEMSLPEFKQWLKGDTKKAVAFKPATVKTGTDNVVTLNSGIPVDQMVQEIGKLAGNVKSALPKLAELGAHVYQRGARTLDSFQKGMREFLGDLYERFKSFMIQVFELAKKKATDERGSFSTEDSDQKEPSLADFGIEEETLDALLDRAEKEMAAGFTPRQSTRKELQKRWKEADATDKARIEEVGYRYTQALKEEEKRQEEGRRKRAEFLAEAEEREKQPAEKVPVHDAPPVIEGINRDNRSLYDTQEQPGPVTRLSPEEAGMEPVRPVAAPRSRALENELDRTSPKDMSDQERQAMHQELFEEQLREGWSGEEQEPADFSDTPPIRDDRDYDDKWFPREMSNYDQTRREERAQQREIERLSNNRHIDPDEDARLAWIRDVPRMLSDAHWKAEKGSTKVKPEERSARTEAFETKFWQAQKDALEHAARAMAGSKVLTSKEPGENSLMLIIGRDLAELAETLYVPDVIKYIERKDGPLSQLTTYPDSIIDLLKYQDRLLSAETNLPSQEATEEEAALAPRSIPDRRDQDQDVAAEEARLERQRKEERENAPRKKSERTFQEDTRAREAADAERSAEDVKKGQQRLLRQKTARKAYQSFKEQDFETRRIISDNWLPFFRAVQVVATEGKATQKNPLDYDKIAKQMYRNRDEGTPGGRAFTKLYLEDRKAAAQIAKQMHQQSEIVRPFAKNRFTEAFQGEAPLHRIAPRKGVEPIYKEHDAFIENAWEKLDAAVKRVAIDSLRADRKGAFGKKGILNLNKVKELLFSNSKVPVKDQNKVLEEMLHRSKMKGLEGSRYPLAEFIDAVHAEGAMHAQDIDGVDAKSDEREGRLPTIGVDEDGNLYRYDHANDIVDLLGNVTTSDLGEQVAQQRGHKDADAYRKYLAKHFRIGWPQFDPPNPSKEYFRRRGEARKAIYQELPHLKAARLTRQYREMNLLDPEVFEKLAEAFPEAGMKAEELYQAYLSRGSFEAVRAMLQAQVQDKVQSRVDKLHAAIRRSKSKEAVRKLATDHLSEKQKGIYGKLSSVKPIQKQIDEMRDLAPEDRSALQVAHQLELRLMKADAPAEVPVATIKHEYGLTPQTEDMFRGKRADDFEKKLLAENPNMQVGTLRNRTARLFYNSIAKAFGVELTIVSDPAYRSRYLGDAKRLVINIQNPASLHKLIGHELFHHIVNRADPAQYRTFVKAIREMVGEPFWSDQMETPSALAEEEMLADLFSEVFTQREFFDTLAQSLPGRTLAQRLIDRMLRLAEKIAGIFNDKSSWTFEGDVLLDPSSMSRVHSLLGDLIGSMGETTHTEARFYTGFGAASVESAEAALKNKKAWLKGSWSKIFPEGAKSRKQVMERLEALLKGALDKAAEWKRKNFDIYLDFGANEQDRVLATTFRHRPNAARKKARDEVAEKHRKTFDDFVARRLNEIRAAIEKQRVDGKITDAQAVKDLAGATRALVLERLHDDLVRNPLPPQKQLERYGQEILDAFADFKTASDKIGKRLQEVLPDLELRQTHFGQFIRWYKKDGTLLDPDFDWTLNEEFSKLEGAKNFTKAKSELSTREIAEEKGLEYKTIDPVEMFLDYVAEAEKVLAFHDMINTGKIKGRVAVFESDFNAHNKGFAPVNDRATKLMERFNINRGYRVKLTEGFLKEDGKVTVYPSRERAEAAAKLYEETTGESAVVVAESYADGKFAVYAEKDGESFQLPELYDTREEANAAVREIRKGKPGITFSARKTKKPPEAQIAQIYFKPDLARMINVSIAQDRIRSHRWGRKAMDVKNRLTSFEFAMSLFHAMTIGQELVSHSATHGVKTGGVKGWVKGFNPLGALKDAQAVASIFDHVSKNPEAANDPAIQKKARELFGVDSIPILEMIDTYTGIGGLMHQDKTLRSDLYSLGKMRFKEGTHALKIEDGEVKIDPGKWSMKAIKDSFSEVRTSLQQNHPDQKFRNFLRTGQFAAMEAPTQWLMEYGIPRIKVAVWAREYAYSLHKNKEKIAGGEMDKTILAIETLKFVEDRFGEMNWDNMWMKPTYRTALQFAFRSYTWFTGSVTALGKGGIDVVKWGWVWAKGEKYELTEQGWWMINAAMAHIMTSGAITAAYMVGAGMEGDEVETPEDTPWLSRILFPRVDMHDPSARITIPSYFTEFWKIYSHLGGGGNEVEPFKMVSGRFNSMVGQAYEAWWSGQNWRGVSITDADDNFIEAFAKKVFHTFAVAPISLSTMASMYRDKGVTRQMGLAVLGFTQAPSKAKYTAATNHAFNLRRKEFKGREVSKDEMEESQELKRAMYAYQNGDPKPLNNLVLAGKLSPRKFKRALTKIPTVKGKANPYYKDPLSQALGGLTIDAALEVWGYMTPAEKRRHRGEILMKARNTFAKGNRSPKDKREIAASMKAAGIL